VVASSQLRNDPSVFPMQLDLRMDEVGEDVAQVIDDGD
jgi:hypothetical protein